MAEQKPRSPKASDPREVVVLPPGATAMDRVYFQELAAMKDMLTSMLPLLEKMIALQLAQVTPSPPPVASYGQLYGGEESPDGTLGQPALDGAPGQAAEEEDGEASDEEDKALAVVAKTLPPQRGGWGRLFQKKA